MRSKYAQAQIRYLEVLRDHNLLDLAMVGKLPPHVEQAARQVVVSEMSGAKTDETKTVLHCTTAEHDEAEAEMLEFLRHYKLVKDMQTAFRKPLPRIFTKGRKYVVKSGYFAGRIVTCRGTDEDVFGTTWLDNVGNPACERFVFRAQADRINILKGRIMVCGLDGEHRDILLHESEMGIAANA
jgi:hypothetical protein